MTPFFIIFMSFVYNVYETLYVFIPICINAHHGQRLATTHTRKLFSQSRLLVVVELVQILQWPRNVGLGDVL